MNVLTIRRPGLPDERFVPEGMFLDLLAAAEALVNGMGMGTAGHLERLEAAIAKAKGEEPETAAP